MSSTALIVGATSGLGHALARHWAADGWTLHLTARDPARITTPGTHHALDLTDPAAIDHFTATTPLADVTVVCAGLLIDEDQCRADPATADRVLAVNLLGPIRLLGALADRCAARGHGTLVGVGSVAGDRGRAYNATYGAAKAGLHAWLSGQRARLAARGVHVLTFKPGLIDTPMIAGRSFPAWMPANPDHVARDLARAVGHHRAVTYSPWWWRPVMWGVRAVPESLFKGVKR